MEPRYAGGRGHRGQGGGAATADVAKTIGDRERTTAEVDDRARLAAARRTAQARNAYRDRDGNGQ
jgi:hypothetical protein